MSDTVGTHNDLHSEQGARSGEHPGRSRNPVIKVADIAWLEFEKPDLARAEEFARAFGFATVLRTPDEVQLRGTDPGAPCVILRRGEQSRFVGHRIQGAGRHRRAPARRCHRYERKGASRITRRHIGRSGRPEWFSGPGGGRHASPARAARPAGARLQFRPSSPAYQRHTATEPESRASTATRATSSSRPPDTPRHSTGTSTTSA